MTIKGIKAAGVPKGTRWLNMWFIWKIQDQIIPPNHKGIAKDIVKLKCLLLVKI